MPKLNAGDQVYRERRTDGARAYGIVGGYTPSGRVKVQFRDLFDKPMTSMFGEPVYQYEDAARLVKIDDWKKDLKRRGVKTPAQRIKGMRS